MMILDQIIQKETKKQQNNQKPAHIVSDFYGPDKELFSRGLPQTKRCKNIEVWEFSTPLDMSGGYSPLPSP